MPTPNSSNWQMADRLAGGNLAAYLWQAVADGKSSRTISDELERDHEIRVSYRTVQNWLKRISHPSTRPAVGQ